LPRGYTSKSNDRSSPASRFAGRPSSLTCCRPLPSVGAGREVESPVPQVLVDEESHLGDGSGGEEFADVHPVDVVEVAPVQQVGRLHGGEFERATVDRPAVAAGVVEPFPGLLAGPDHVPASVAFIRRTCPGRPKPLCLGVGRGDRLTPAGRVQTASPAGRLEHGEPAVALPDDDARGE